MVAAVSRRFGLIRAKQVRGAQRLVQMRGQCLLVVILAE
jgi:hypothetical protein